MFFVCHTRYVCLCTIQASHAAACAFFLEGARRYNTGGAGKSVHLEYQNPRQAQPLPKFPKGTNGVCGQLITLVVLRAAVLQILFWSDAL